MSSFRAISRNWIEAVTQACHFCVEIHQKFTCEVKNNGKISLSDVLLMKSNEK